LIPRCVWRLRGRFFQKLSTSASRFRTTRALNSRQRTQLQKLCPREYLPAYPVSTPLAFIGEPPLPANFNIEPQPGVVVRDGRGRRAFRARENPGTIQQLLLFPKISHNREVASEVFCVARGSDPGQSSFSVPRLEIVEAILPRHARTPEMALTENRDGTICWPRLRSPCGSGAFAIVGACWSFENAEPLLEILTTTLSSSRWCLSRRWPSEF